MWHGELRDMRHCHFLNSTRDIGDPPPPPIKAPIVHFAFAGSGHLLRGGVCVGSGAKGFGSVIVFGIIFDV